MAKSKKDDYLAVALEDINSKFDFLVEIIAPMRKDVIDLKNKYDKDVPTMKADVKVIKAAAIQTNKKVVELDERVTRLEAKRAYQ